MITLVAPQPAITKLISDFSTERLESAAIGLCVPTKLRSGAWRLLLKEIHIAPPDAYEQRTPVSARLTASFGLPFERKAKESGWSLVYFHSHPHESSAVEFSAVDDAAEKPLAQYAASRAPGVPHLAVVLGKNSVRARKIGTVESVRVVELGDTVSVLTDRSSSSNHDDIFDRQIRAFGEDGQRRIQSLRIAVVGLGGTGSIVAQELAYLGAKNFVLIDRDRVERTNLNRTVGASEADVGAAKVEIAARHISSIRSGADVQCFIGDVVEEGIAQTIIDCDFVFCCTDSHASRHLLNQIAYQYGVPTIDMGVSITTRNGRQPMIAGHCKALSPSLPCLWCIESLDPRAVREELMTVEQRNADPYFNAGTGVPQPAVISLNGTMSSLAVTMFLAMVAGVPSSPRYLVYDAERGRVNGVAAKLDSHCNFCGPESSMFFGQSLPLPVRRK